MLRTRGYRYELRVNNKERTLLAKCAGISRFAWNWGLAARTQRYQTHTEATRHTDAMTQHKELNRLKPTKFPWMYEVSKCIPQEALRDLDRAYQNFFTNLQQRKRKQTTRYVGLPKFKKKGKSKDSFRLTGAIRLFPEVNQVQLPRLGKLRLKEKPNVPASARILNVTVSRTADHWYVALTVKEEQPDPAPNKGPLVALDKGLSVFVMLSSGILIPRPKFLLRQARKQCRLAKAHSRKENGSKNKQKSALRLARFYRHITNQRHNFLHQTSTYLAKNHSVIVTEDLNVKGLMENKKLNKYWADLSHGMFQRLLTYKASLYGSTVIAIGRWFPSSKLCSNCLYYDRDLMLADRVFRCPLCGLSLDRDQNAAFNIANYYFIYQSLIKSVAESSAETLNACGEAVRLADQQVRVGESGRTAPKSVGFFSPSCLTWVSLSERNMSIAHQKFLFFRTQSLSFIPFF
ncbi:MAG: RNA-guided endonuclease InsQ/TnpB family protein [Candidatus Hodarchaeota archaeon]